MLTQTFNKVVDQQHSLYDVAKEKLEHQRDTEFHYGARGQLDKIGRIETANTQVQHSSEALLKKQKKDKAQIDHILFMERLREELDGILERMDAIVQDMRDQMRKMRRGLKALESDDVTIMAAFLIDEYGDKYDRKTLENMSTEEIETEVRDNVLSAEEQYERLKDEYKALAKKYDQKIKDHPDLKEQLTAEFKDHEERIQAEVEAMERSFQEIRDEVGRVSGATPTNQIRAQENANSEIECIEDDFFADAPDLTAEFEHAASGNTVEIERKVTITPTQNTITPRPS